jgi:hypothetical protein
MGAAHLRGIHDAHQGEQDDGEKGGDSQGQSLSAPEECYEDDGIGTVGFLWARRRGRDVGEGRYPRVFPCPAPERNGAICNRWGEPMSLIPKPKVPSQNRN